MGERSRGGSVLVAALVVDSLGNGLFAPLSLIYFTRLTGVPLALVGLLLTIAQVVALPVPVWAGTWADRIGPRPLVVAAEVAMAAGFGLYTLVTGPVGILVAATVVAVGVRVFWCTIFTLLADHADGGTRGADSWFALANAARTAGLALGGLATGLVVADGRSVAYRGIALGAAACLALAAVLVAARVRAPHRAATATAPAGYRDLVRDRPYLGLVALNTVYAGTSMMLALALPTIVLDRGAPAWLTAVLLAGNALLITVASSPIVRRLARVRRTRGIAAAAVLWTGWCATVALAGVAGAVAASVLLTCGTLLFTVAEAVHAPLSQSLASGAAPPAARGRYLAVFQYSFAAAGVVAPAFFTGLYTLGPALPFAVLGAVNALSVLAVLRLERSLPQSARAAT